jgi:hypothetical protein
VEEKTYWDSFKAGSENVVAKIRALLDNQRPYRIQKSSTMVTKASTGVAA